MQDLIGNRSNLTSYYLCIFMKKIDLYGYLYYNSFVCGTLIPTKTNSERLLTMKLTIRIFALSVVIAGAAAASVSSATTRILPSHQSATSANPVPLCGPGMPGCPPVADAR